MRALTIFKQKDLPAETKLKEIPPDEQASSTVSLVQKSL